MFFKPGELDLVSKAGSGVSTLVSIRMRLDHHPGLHRRMVEYVKAASLPLSEAEDKQ